MIYLLEDLVESAVTMKTVLFLGFDKDWGLTYHFVDWIIALEKAANNKLKLIFLTLNKEQYSGSQQKLKNPQFTDVVIVNAPDDLQELNFLLSVDMAHCYGFRQVTTMLKIKKAIGLSPYVRLPGNIDREYVPTIVKKMNLSVCA